MERAGEEILLVKGDVQEQLAKQRLGSFRVSRVENAITQVGCMRCVRLAGSISAGHRNIGSVTLRNARLRQVDEFIAGAGTKYQEECNRE
jgi:hypothetical protein